MDVNDLVNEMKIEMQQIAYEYAKRGANLVLVARREQRLRVVSNKAKEIGANHVIIIAADVIKEDDCRRFITQAVNYYGRGTLLSPFPREMLGIGYLIGQAIVLVLTKRLFVLDDEFDAVDHLVNTASLGHTFYFEEVSDTTVFPHLLVCVSSGLYCCALIILIHIRY